MAFFRNTSQANTYYLGLEDLMDPIGTENLGDYDDMIVRVHMMAAPGPATGLLFGSGLVGLGLWGLGRRRQNRG